MPVTHMDAATKADADLRIDAGWVITMDAAGSVLTAHSIWVQDGRITRIEPTPEPADDRQDAARIIDRRQGIVMPGLINCHTHLPMNLLRGFADDLPLESWLTEHIWPAEAALMGPDYVADGTELALAESLLGGVTTVNDMYFFPDVIASTCARIGIRARMGMIVIDFPSAWANAVDTYFDKGLALHDQLKDNALLTTTFAPHAPYSVSRAPLERIAMLSAELDVPVHIHVQETAREVADFKALHGLRPLAYLHQLGLVNPQLLAVHLTQLTDNEIDLLAENGAHALHCPESNLKLASGFCPLAKLRAAGVNVGIGTDSAASNNDIDLLGEMQTAAMLAKAVAGDASVVPALDALRMITSDAAVALGLQKDIGSVEVGKAADLIQIEPDLTMLPLFDPVSQVVFATTRDRVQDVWVNGQQLLRNRTLLTIDTDNLQQRTLDWQQRIATLR